MTQHLTIMRHWSKRKRHSQTSSSSSESEDEFEGIMPKESAPDHPEIQIANSDDSAATAGASSTTREPKRTKRGSK